jgi:hypothetical protein
MCGVHCPSQQATLVPRVEGFEGQLNSERTTFNGTCFWLWTFINAIIRDTIDDIEKKVTYQCGDRYDKMRVIRLQVSAMWYRSDGGASQYWIWGEVGGGGSCLADVFMSKTSEGWSLRPSLAMNAHPVPHDVPPGRDEAGSCCGVGCCDG